MTNIESKVHYYYESGILNNLCDRFGGCLERLTAKDNLDLLSTIAAWQSSDTAQQALGEDPLPLWMWLRFDFAENLTRWNSDEINEALNILRDASEGEALALLRAIPAQLANGVYLQ